MRFPDKVFERVKKKIAKLKESGIEDIQVAVITNPCMEVEDSLNSEQLLNLLNAMDTSLKELVGEKNYKYDVNFHFQLEESPERWRKDEANKALITSPLLKKFNTIEEFRETKDWKNAEIVFEAFLEKNPAAREDFNTRLQLDADTFIKHQEKTNKNIEKDTNKLKEYYRKIAIDRLCWTPELSGPANVIHVYLSYHDDTLRASKFIDTYAKDMRKNTNLLINARFKYSEIDFKADEDKKAQEEQLKQISEIKPEQQVQLKQEQTQEAGAGLRPRKKSPSSLKMEIYANTALLLWRAGRAGESKQILRKGAQIIKAENAARCRRYGKVQS